MRPMACLNPCAFCGTYVSSMRTAGVERRLAVQLAAIGRRFGNYPINGYKCINRNEFDGARSGSASPFENHFRMLQVKPGGLLVGTRKGQKLRFAV